MGKKPTETKQIKISKEIYDKARQHADERDVPFKDYIENIIETVLLYPGPFEVTEHSKKKRGRPSNADKNKEQEWTKFITSKEGVATCIFQHFLKREIVQPILSEDNAVVFAFFDESLPDGLIKVPIEEIIDRIARDLESFFVSVCGDKENNSVYDKKSIYYDAGGIETIDVIRAKLTKDQFIGFLMGNVIKYSSRINHKGDPARDAEKCAAYAGWLSEELGK